MEGLISAIIFSVFAFSVMYFLANIGGRSRKREADRRRVAIMKRNEEIDAQKRQIILYLKNVAEQEKLNNKEREDPFTLLKPALIFGETQPVFEPKPEIKKLKTDGIQFCEIDSLDYLCIISKEFEIFYWWREGKTETKIRVLRQHASSKCEKYNSSKQYLFYKTDEGACLIPSKLIDRINNDDKIELTLKSLKSEYFKSYRIHLGSRVRKGFTDQYRKYLYNDMDTYQKNIAVVVEVNGSRISSWEWLKDEQYFGSKLEKSSITSYSAPSAKKYDEIWQNLLELQEHSLNNWGGSNPKKKLAGVYAILSTQSEECYIGSSVNMLTRKGAHLSSLKHSKHHSYRFQNAFDDCKGEGFEFIILKVVTDDDWEEQRLGSWGRASTVAEDNKRRKQYLKRLEQDNIDKFYPSLNTLDDARGTKHWT